jgi:exonuclease VII large subunit
LPATGGTWKSPEIAVSRIDALSPLQTLSRGYSITRLSKTGEVLTDAVRAEPGDQIDVLLMRGSLEARITCVHADTPVKTSE